MITEKDHYFMRISEAVKTASKCLRAKYGCVIVGADGRIKGTGYNGKPQGSKCDHICFREGVPEAERTHECCIHAERNALLYTDALDRKDGTMYVTGTPCKTCALHIMNSGIARLVYLEYSHSDSGKRVSTDEFWEMYGVPIIREVIRVEEKKETLGSNTSLSDESIQQTDSSTETERPLRGSLLQKEGRDDLPLSEVLSSLRGRYDQPRNYRKG